VAKGKAVERADRVAASLKALVMKREGYGWQDIADRLGTTATEAQALARVAYAQMSVQTADELRTAIVRKATVDLSLAESQGERTALYRVLLAAEAQRARLLGLAIPAGADYA